jgi:menaquinone-dependent protoporphyrinogen oxidase
MSELPVFFATTDGQTRRIAEAFAAHARSLGIDSHAIDVTSAQARSFSWPRARGVVLAASVHAGAHQREAERFVRQNVVEFNRRPSVFVSVSLSICSKQPHEAQAARAIATTFPVHLGWRAGRVVCVAGRLAYTQYGLLKRYVMRRIARKAGGPTDTSRDHEMTDWNQVRTVASELVDAVQRQVSKAPAMSVSGS